LGGVEGWTTRQLFNGRATRLLGSYDVILQ
jgi:hypothetical protein